MYPSIIVLNVLVKLGNLPSATVGAGCHLVVVVRRELGVNLEEVSEDRKIVFGFNRTRILKRKKWCCEDCLSL